MAYIVDNISLVGRAEMLTRYMAALRTFSKQPGLENTWFETHVNQAAQSLLEKEGYDFLTPAQIAEEIATCPDECREDLEEIIHLWNLHLGYMAQKLVLYHEETNLEKATALASETHGSFDIISKAPVFEPKTQEISEKRMCEDLLKGLQFLLKAFQKEWFCLTEDGDLLALGTEKIGVITTDSFVQGSPWYLDIEGHLPKAAFEHFEKIGVFVPPLHFPATESSNTPLYLAIDHSVSRWLDTSAGVSRVRLTREELLGPGGHENICDKATCLFTSYLSALRTFAKANGWVDLVDETAVKEDADTEGGHVLVKKRVAAPVLCDLWTDSETPEKRRDDLILIRSFLDQFSDILSRDVFKVVYRDAIIEIFSEESFLCKTHIRPEGIVISFKPYFTKQNIDQYMTGPVSSYFKIIETLFNENNRRFFFYQINANPLTNYPIHKTEDITIGGVVVSRHVLTDWARIDFFAHMKTQCVDPILKMIDEELDSPVF